MEIIFLKLTLIPLPIIYTHAKTAKPAVSYLPVFMFCQQMKENKISPCILIYFQISTEEKRKKIYIEKKNVEVTLLENEIEKKCRLYETCPNSLKNSSILSVTVMIFDYKDFRFERIQSLLYKFRSHYYGYTFSFSFCNCQST